MSYPFNKPAVPVRVLVKTLLNLIARFKGHHTVCIEGTLTVNGVPIIKGGKCASLTPNTKGADGIIAPE